MPREIRESDWKIFRDLRAVALDRFCAQVMSEVSRIISDSREGGHARYRAIWQILQQRDRELVRIFDTLRRSTALEQIAFIHERKLFTGEEMARFSDETREWVEGFLRIVRG